MSPMYKLILKTGLFILVFSILNYINIGFQAFMVYMCFILIKKILKKDYKGFRNYILYILALLLFNYFNINFLWLILLLLIFTLVRQKNFKTIIRHPILFYELCFRKVQLMWVEEVIRHGLKFSNYIDMKSDLQKRIREIENKGVRIEV